MTQPAKSDQHIDDEVSLLQLARILFQERRLLIAGVGIGLGLAFYLAVSRKEVYSATVVVTAAARSGSSSRISGLASQLGLNDGGAAGSVGVAVTPDLLELLATSDVVLGRLMDDSVAVGLPGSPGALLTTFGPTRDTPPAMRRLLAVRALKGAITTRRDKMTGTLAIEVSTRSPEVSHAVALALVARLNDHLLLLGRQQASEERRFVSSRVVERKGELRAAEDRLASFLTTNRQYQSSPQLVLEYERIQREVALQQEVRVQLSQALEEAGLREARDTPVIIVLDPAEVPIFPKPRKLLQTLALGLFGGFLVGTFAAFARFALVQRGWSVSRDWLTTSTPARKL